MAAHIDPPALSFHSRRLGRTVTLTPRDLAVLDHLDCFHRLDFEQLSLLLDIAPTNRRRFRRRLHTLGEARFIHVFYGGLGRPPIFALLDRGMEYHQRAQAAAVGEALPPDWEPSRITRPRHQEAELIRRHDIGVSNLGMIQERWTRQHPTRFFLRHRELFRLGTTAAIRSSLSWPTTVSWQGQTLTFNVKPDLFTGIGFHDRPHGRNVRYFAAEIDCGTETRRPTRLDARGQSLFRKLLAYQATIDHDLLTGYLGIDHFTVLFVLETERRRESILALADEVLESQAAQERMLFGLRPPCPTNGDHADFSALPWFDGRGKEACVRL